jgi:hypothetical protein
MFTPLNGCNILLRIMWEDSYRVALVQLGGEGLYQGISEGQARVWS